MIVRKLGDKKPKVLVFQGSPRDKDTCPNMDSKSHNIVEHMTTKWSPFIDFDIIDLAVNQSKKSTIQPCKGCISTAGGYHCHFPCSCYFKNDESKPDLMKDLNVYELLHECDAFIVVSPIHWHSLTAQVKTLFDRLVCTNQTLSVEDAKNLMGPDNIKNSDITGRYSISGKYENLLRNHLQGKFAAFYVHGDDGAKDYTKNELPESYDVLSDPFSGDPKATVMPYILQMKYSGVFVPDDLVEAFYINKDVDYYTANKTYKKQKEFTDRADTLIENLLIHLDNRKL
jgi:multimeric flavodoxin WrbA